MVHILSSAGIQEDISFTETTVEEWYKIIGVDLTSLFVCSRVAVKQMQKQMNPRGGYIMNRNPTISPMQHPRYRQAEYCTWKNSAGIQNLWLSANITNSCIDRACSSSSTWVGNIGRRPFNANTSIYMCNYYGSSTHDKL